ncbi:MAG: diphthamide synthesis protein [Candidatus Pacearchaeota archaeon]|nr:diphthamide synthesis protein [Candidatus Pacearchaeota archaeon]
MQNKTISEIEQEYDLEIDRIVSEIKKNNAKRVLLQFPDGMKPYSTVIAKEIESKTKATCLIWLSSCFGACDTPNLGASEKDIDLVISFGHSERKQRK